MPFSRSTVTLNYHPCSCHDSWERKHALHDPNSKVQGNRRSNAAATGVQIFNFLHHPLPAVILLSLPCGVRAGTVDVRTKQGKGSHPKNDSLLEDNAAFSVQARCSEGGSGCTVFLARAVAAVAMILPVQHAFTTEDPWLTLVKCLCCPARSSNTQLPRSCVERCMPRITMLSGSHSKPIAICTCSCSPGLQSKLCVMSSPSLDCAQLPGHLGRPDPPDV